MIFSRTHKSLYRDQPSTPAHEPRILCNNLSLGRILRTLPNKTSSGLNLIPPIVLKHLTQKIIDTYVIILITPLITITFP